MGLPRRDFIATALVAVAAVVYGLWAAGVWSSVRATGIVVLVLGFAASASAVVPGFEQLMRGNKMYLALTSIIGLGAFIAGLQMLVSASATGLTVMMVAMGLLWLIATIHHVMLAKRAAVTQSTSITAPAEHRHAA